MTTWGKVNSALSKLQAILMRQTKSYYLKWSWIVHMENYTTKMTQLHIKFARTIDNALINKKNIYIYKRRQYFYQINVHDWKLSSLTKSFLSNATLHHKSLNSSSRGEKQRQESMGIEAPLNRSYFFFKHGILKGKEACCSFKRPSCWKSTYLKFKIRWTFYRCWFYYGRIPFSNRKER